MLYSKEGYQLECNKPLHRGWGDQNGIFLLLNFSMIPKIYLVFSILGFLCIHACAVNVNLLFEKFCFSP